jgi:hypothetical protein
MLPSRHRFMFIRNASAFLAAVLLTYTLASVAVTQAALAQLQAIGVFISMAVRLRTTGLDLLGMSTSLLPLIALALAVGFVIASGLARVLPRLRLLLLLAAGGVALLALHAALLAVLGVTPFPATRTYPGLGLQLASGVAGGYLYWRLSRVRPDDQPRLPAAAP